MEIRSSPETKGKLTGLFSLSTLSEMQSIDKQKMEIKKKGWIRNLESFFVTSLLEAKFGIKSEDYIQLHLESQKNSNYNLNYILDLYLLFTMGVCSWKVKDG